MHVKLAIPTSEGTFTAYYSERGLARLDFPDDPRESNGALASLPTDPVAIQKWHKTTTRALDDCLAGRTPDALPPLDLSAGTDFQRRVWEALRRIAPGNTRSYGEVATTLGKAGASRAVGAACGANPIPVLVPCHRVLAANRRLGGFSGGLGWKRKLLAREGVKLADPALFLRAQ